MGCIVLVSKCSAIIFIFLKYFYIENVILFKGMFKYIQFNYISFKFQEKVDHINEHTKDCHTVLPTPWLLESILWFFSFSCHYNRSVVLLSMQSSSIPVNNTADIKDYLRTLSPIGFFQISENHVKRQQKIYARTISSLNIISNRSQIMLSLNILKCITIYNTSHNSSREISSRYHWN